MQVTHVSLVGQAGFCVFRTGHRSRLLPISVLPVLDGHQDLVEDIKDPVHLGAGDRERGLDFQDVAEAGVPGGAEDDAQIHRPPVHLQRLGGGRLLGLLIAYEFDADEQARPADVTDERVPRLHLVQGAGGVPAHVGAGLHQAVSLEDFQGRQPGGEADRELAEGQRLVPGLEPGQRRAGQDPGQREPPPTPFPNTRMSGVTP